uniref:Putative secreted peptide n=1 Tax=Anopheles braziliensis TaxID=58242 RepID=A0A2M3ZUE6_9DIPT
MKSVFSLCGAWCVWCCARGTAAWYTGHTGHTGTNTSRDSITASGTNANMRPDGGASVDGGTVTAVTGRSRRRRRRRQLHGPPPVAKQFLLDIGRQGMEHFTVNVGGK